MKIHEAFAAPITGLAAAVGADGRWYALSCGGFQSRCWPVEAVRASESALFGEDWHRHAEALVLVRTPEGGEIVIGRDGRCRLWRWDRRTGALIRPPIEHTALLEQMSRRYPMAAALTSNGPVLCTEARGGGLRRWDVRTGAPLGAPVTRPDMIVRSLAAVDRSARSKAAALSGSDPSARRSLFLSGGSDGLVRRWDAETGTEIGDPMTGCGKAVEIAVLRLAEHGELVCVLNAQGELHRRRLDTGEAFGPPTQTGRNPSVSGRALPYDGRMACITTADDDRGVIAVCTSPLSAVVLWNVVTGKPFGKLSPPQSGPSFIRGLAAARLPDGTPIVLVGDDDGRVRRFHAFSCEEIGAPTRPHGTRAWTGTAARLADGRTVVAVAGGPGVCRFDARTGGSAGDPDRPWKVSVNGMAVARLSGGRPLLVAALDDGIARMDLSSGDELARTPDEKPFTIWDVATATLADGRVVIGGAGHDGLIYRWDAETGAALGKPLIGHRPSAKAIAATTSPHDGSALFVTGCEGGKVIRWTRRAASSSDRRWTLRRSTSSISRSWTTPRGGAC